jgi:serine/threonine protein kinase
MVSSPKYTPPELLRGRAASAVQSDLYALGFIIYEYLVGTALFRKEFPGLDERGTGLGWMEWHSDPAKRPRPAAELVPGTPAALSQLLERMMEKDLTKRCGAYEEALPIVLGLASRTQKTQQVRLRVQKGQDPVGPATRYGVAHIAAIAGIIFVVLIALAALAARLLR